MSAWRDGLIVSAVAAPFVAALVTMLPLLLTTRRQLERSARLLQRLTRVVMRHEEELAKANQRPPEWIRSVREELDDDFP